jgi:serine/threonine protein kinase/tetratricopeptide (TPR) repeat protein
VEQNVRDWQRLEGLFAAAVELPEDGRAAFVERETGADPELRRQLEALLESDAGAADRIFRAVGDAARAAAAPADWTGRRFGPYRLVREIGRGGMGLVFEAVRDDDEYRKTVAVKIALGWRDADLLGGHVRYERQILAGLEHPSIARFLDGGTQDGIPYFAMEYVEGLPLTEYAVQRGLKVRERVELFRQVCSAVDYAHQNLVVHRDLKPRNILVNAEGVPKLLDFGIAKLLVPVERERTRSVSYNAPIWTPNYASPEQVRAQPVTTRTDVYALGLLLFELLTGERGQTADTSSPLALDRSICETEPPTASQCADRHGDHTLARRLRGDLDTIVSMAIRKEPERRYSSAAALSDDLGRHLAGKPVKARPQTFSYRAGKLLRRHRLAFAAAALVMLSITCGVAATVYQARRAERRFQQVRKLANSMMFDVQDRLQNLAGATETREWAVRTALVYLDDLAKDAGRDNALLAELANAYLRIGDVQGYTVAPSLGHRDAALKSYRKAKSIAERLAKQAPGPGAQRLLAQTGQRIGAILRATQRTAAAIEEYQRALAIEEPLYAAHPSDPDASLLNAILVSLGQSQAATGRVTEAARSWLRAADVSTRSASDPTQAELVRTQQYVIRALMYSGDLEGAEALSQEAVRVRERLAAAHPADAALQRSLMNAYGQAGYLYFHPVFLTFGDRRAAPVWEEKALAIARSLAAADSSNETAQSDLHIAAADVCGSLDGVDPARAIGYCREAMAVAEGLPVLLSAEAELSYQAEALQKLGRSAEALRTLQSAMKICEDLLRLDPHYALRQMILRGHNQMAGLLLATGDRAGAFDRHRQAVALAEQLEAAIPTNPVSRRDLADTYEAFGRFYERYDWPQARGWHQKSLEIWSAWPASFHSGKMDQTRRRQAEQAVARCSAAMGERTNPHFP